uniref:Uncharacterized protein n=1 Tax=Octopus bimaculoides TaxID=37653 RepID=A0A0L8IG79_OCTBM
MTSVASGLSKNGGGKDFVTLSTTAYCPSLVVIRDRLCYSVSPRTPAGTSRSANRTRRLPFWN